MPARGSLALLPRTKKGLVLFWTALFMLSVALQYGAAAFPQKTLALSGAVYTSNSDGTGIDLNIYDTKGSVYLTGGPCQSGSHLDDGQYYYEVTSPNGVLLSSDAISERLITISGGFIVSSTGHVTHDVACTSDPAITVQLLPYDTTPNSGGEYKLTVATKTSVEDCKGFDATSSTFEICGSAESKSDNYKVGPNGNLKVVKAVDGGDVSGEFGVHVDCGTDGEFDRTITFPDPGFVTIANIAAGAQCTVTETSVADAPANFHWGQVTISGKATIGDDTTVTVTVTNHLVRDVGSLQITKAVTGGPEGFTGTFKVHVDCGQDGTFDGTISFPTPGSVTIGNIPAGAECTVTETDASDPAAGFTWGTVTIAGSPAAIGAGATAHVTVTNPLVEIPPEFGSLTVTKVIPDVPAGFTGSFDIRVTCVGGFTADRTIAYPNPGSVTITGIPAGAECLVVELGKSAPPAGFNWGGSNINGPVTIAANQTAAITVTNLLSEVQATPTLTVTKTNSAPIVGGLHTASEGASVTYTLTYTVTGSITNGVLTDHLPAGVTFVSAANGGAFTFVNYDAGTRTLTWTAAAASDGTGSVTYIVTVDKGAAKLAQPLVNTATIDSAETTPVTATSNLFVPAPPLAETAPPTDIAGSTDGNVSGGSMLFILLALAGLVLAIAFVAPTPAAIRKRR